MSCRASHAIIFSDGEWEEPQDEDGPSSNQHRKVKQKKAHDDHSDPSSTDVEKQNYGGQVGQPQINLLDDLLSMGEDEQQTLLAAGPNFDTASNTTLHSADQLLGGGGSQEDVKELTGYDALRSLDQEYAQDR